MGTNACQAPFAEPSGMAIIRGMKTTLKLLNPLYRRSLPARGLPPSGEKSTSENATMSIATNPYDERDRGIFDIWNSEVLGELISHEPGIQQRLLKLFLVNAQQQRDAIKAAAEHEDFSTLITQAHTLKSAARSVGAMAVGALCQQLESASSAQDLPCCQRLAQALPAAVAKAQARIEHHLATFDATESPPNS